MADKLITIVNFTYGADPVSEAELAKMKLKSYGIECFLAGKNFVGMYWLCSGADRGVKLQVKESDATKALEILKNNKQTDHEETNEDLITESFDALCPKCLSENIEYEKFSKKAFYLSILFLRFPFPLLKKRYSCKNCGHTWKDR